MNNLGAPGTGRGRDLGVPNQTGQGQYSHMSNTDLGVPQQEGRGQYLVIPDREGQGLNLEAPNYEGRGSDLGMPDRNGQCHDAGVPGTSGRRDYSSSRQNYERPADDDLRSRQNKRRRRYNSSPEESDYIRHDRTNTQIKMAPNENKCKGCRHNITTKELLTCFACTSKYDLLCANVGLKRFNLMDKEQKLNWRCPECRSQLPKTDNTNTPIRLPSQLVHTSTISDASVSDDIETRNVTQRSKPKEDITKKYITEESLRKIVQEELSCVFEEKLNKLISEQIKTINIRFAELSESISFFNKQYEELKTIVEGKTVIISELHKDSDILKSSIKDLSHRLYLAEQSMRESNLEINGIPENRAENLYNVISQISKTVNCPIEMNDINHISLVAKLDKEKNRPRTVIVKLRSPQHRDRFLAAVAKFNRNNPKDKLSTLHLGMAAPVKPVFVAEHLTPINKSLHAAARLKAKKESFKFVWVRNGLLDYVTTGPTPIEAGTERRLGSSLRPLGHSVRDLRTGRSLENYYRYAATFFIN
ncbi:unnamed protein product [Diatraea saccharalis]|uniref:PHD-type domain-containing protein n=1 Tax=Diatraea saccharalis TaxID=40085 RepID=A0A9N9WFZ1_9NEOP|nr:unnamed protein product [Diatraea saccharalis]